MTTRVPAKLTHLDHAGRVHMVDVGGKPATERAATAEARIRLGPALTRQIRATGSGKKGEVLATARLAGIMGARRVADLIPLCHTLNLSGIDIETAWERDGLRLQATARAHGPTGVEMEALTAVSIAALTVYDMTKALSKRITITDIRLLEKSGGRSGHFRAEAAR